MKYCHLPLILAIASGLTFGQSLTGAKHAPDLENVDLQSNVDVIVQFDQVPTEAYHRRVLARGGQHHRTLATLSGAAYTIPAATLQDLENDPTVVHISVDHKLAAKLDYTTAAVNAPAAWNAAKPLTGTGIGVALIDSGIGPNPGLPNAPVYSQSFVPNDSSALDSYGHGEHIAGIISAAGTGCVAPCYRTFKGVAPGANLIDLRALDVNGEASDSTVIAAIQAAINLKSTYNIRVINLSLGRPVFESYKLDPLCQAAEAAWKAGIVVVVAAGNDGRDDSEGNQGYGTINSPGNDPYVITVGAMKTNGTYTRTDDTIASYSSKGPSLIDNIVKPDIVAPGNQVISVKPQIAATLSTNYPGNLIPRYIFDPYGPTSSSTPYYWSQWYYMLSGTSMSAGVVTGAVAILLQSNPALTPDQVKIRLMKTAYRTFPSQSIATDAVTGQQYVSYYDIFTVGAGYLDIAAALADTSVLSGNSLSPISYYNWSTKKTAVHYDTSSAWASSGAWGSLNANSAAWGSSLVASDKSVVGGSSVAWAQSGAWGSTGLFATSTNSAQSTLWSESGAWGSLGSQAQSGAWGAATESSDKTPIIISGEN